MSAIACGNSPFLARMKNIRPEPDRALFIPSLWLLITAAITLAPHASHLPPWLIGVCALILAWRGWTLFQPELHANTRTHKALVLMLAVMTAIGIRHHFGHFFGKDPGIALLAVLLCLKQLEVGSSRDIRAAVLLCFFLQLGLFFYDQSLPVAAMALVGTLFATVALLALETGGTPLRASLRTAALMLVQAVPFLLVLFLLFPRIPGPLWGLPADAFSGLTGLSDTMEPGSISQLGLSDAIAFRADFAGTPPPPALRYWRGPVLTEFDGRTWRAGRFLVHRQPTYTVQGSAYDYRLTLEPHNQRWLLALDFTDAGPEGVFHASDFQVLSGTPVRSRSRFELRAYPETPVGLAEHRSVLAGSTRLPAGGNPRARALAREIADASTGPGDTLERMLHAMRDMALVYTLRPPLLGAQPVDEFLFDTRRGFCEHFASAFVFLMRAADIPARVVTGYQGGEINPVDRSMVVRQSDAHAWAEVWLAGRGWVRVDPTALAAPSRIEEGLASALPRGEPLPFMMRPAMRWLRDMRHQWEALSNAWNQSVIGYNIERQRRLLEGLGFEAPDWRTLTAMMGGGAALVMTALFGWAVLQVRRRDPLDRAWHAFCTRLARKGLQRLPWEGPIDYARRIGDHYPASAAAIREIAQTYARLRYGAVDDDLAATTRRLARRIRNLTLK